MGILSRNIVYLLQCTYICGLYRMTKLMLDHILV